MKKQKVCIIGAGPSGISSLVSFYKEREKGNVIPEIDCFEKQDNWGGLWNYTWRTGLDENGIPVHGSMYRHLWSNGPKECLEFSNYTFDEHFKQAIPSFPPREVLHDYILGRVKNTNIRDWIKFNHNVQYCSFNKSTKLFEIIIRDNKSNNNIINYYDYVICCSGHFSIPNVPQWEGMESYPGRILHSHDFRNAEEMQGKDLLIIGTSYSAEDIASQCFKYGVKSVTLSWRTKPMGFKWPDNFETKPLLSRIDNNLCYFKDGTSKKIDVIILCTGYLHSFPFLSNELKLKTINKLYPDMLYNGVVHINNPQLYFIGMQDQWFTFNMFDAQAWYIRDIIYNRIKLPSVDNMKQNLNIWQEKEQKLDGSDESSINFQADYLKHILKQSDLEPFDIDGVVKCFLEWEHNKHIDIMTFRDKCHKSVITKTMGTIHTKKWLEEYDDSLNNFINKNNL